MIRQSVGEAKQRALDVGRLPKGGLAAPMAMAALAALSFAGCGGSAKRYDSKTEASLERTIRPTMVAIAKKAIKLQARYPQEVSITRVGKGLVAINANPFADAYGRSGDIQVVVGTQPRNSQPNPDAVIAVSLDTFDNPPKGEGVPGSTGLAMTSPAGGRHGYGGVASPNDHPDGWSAQEVGETSLSGPASNGFAFDSSDSDLFVADPNDPTKSAGPVATARTVVQDALGLYDSVSTVIAEEAGQY